jgi:hypothetical protein
MHGVLGVLPSMAVAETISPNPIIAEILLPAVDVRRFRVRPKPGLKAPSPRWMDGIAGFTPGKAPGTGAAIGAANPKNIATGVAGI